MSQSPVMSPLSEGALRGNEPSPTGVNEVPLSPQAPRTQYTPLSWMSTPRSIQTNEDDSHVTPMDLNADLAAEKKGGKKLKKTRTNSKKSRTNSKKTRTNSKKTRTKSKKSKKTRTYSKKTRTYSKKSRKYNKRGGKGFTTSETNGKESQ